MQQRLYFTGIIYQLICCAMILLLPKGTSFYGVFPILHRSKTRGFLVPIFLPERWQFSAVLRSCSYHGRAKFWRTDSELFCHFCRAAPPRVRQAGGTEHPRSAHLYKLHFVSFVVRSAMLKKPRNGGNFRDRMCNCNTVTRDAITIAIWSGLHPAPC